MEGYTLDDLRNEIALMRAEQETFFVTLLTASLASGARFDVTNEEIGDVVVKQLNAAKDLAVRRAARP